MQEVFGKGSILSYPCFSILDTIKTFVCSIPFFSTYPLKLHIKSSSFPICPSTFSGGTACDPMV